MWILIVIVVGGISIIPLSLLFMWIQHKQSKGGEYYNEKSTYNQPQHDGIDSLNSPVYFSQEQREFLNRVSGFYKIRYITQADIQKFNIHVMSDLFLAMPGWSIWDSSIHEADGQYKRMERASTEKEITIMSYDPKYQLAKVQGKTSIYLTSCKRCSCPDYRKRRMPCKHMYALAIELDGNVDKCILDSGHAPLYGLTLALAGHLPKSKKGVGGIRADITDRGGKWAENIEFESSAVVMGSNPSQARQHRAEEFDMEILSPELIPDIFTEKEPDAKSD